MITLKQITLLLLFLAFTPPIYGQGAQWANNIPVINLDNAAGIIYDGRDVAVASNGDVYMAGEFFGTMQFGTEEVTSTDIGGIIVTTDGYLAKYDSEGNFLLMHHFQCESIGGLMGVETDALGNVYFAGSFDKAVTLGNTTVGDNQEFMVLGKLNAAGDLEWMKAIENAQNIYNFKLVDDERLVVSGVLNGPADFDGTIVNSADGDLYLAHLNTEDGSFNWALSFGRPILNNTMGLAADADGNIYCSSSSPGGTVIGSYMIPGTIYNNSPFLIKFSPAGEMLWLEYGVAGDSSGGSLIPSALAINRDNGAIYMTGSFSAETMTLGDVTFSQVPYTGTHFFLAKYNPLGEVQWVTTSRQDANASTVGALDAAMADNGDVFILGAFKNGTNAYLPAPGNDLSLSAPNGGSNAFLARYKPNGDFDWGTVIWAEEAGCRANRLAVAGPNQVVTAGRFYEQIHFGNRTLTAEYPGTLQKENIFITKIDGGLSVATQEVLTPISWTLFPNPVIDQLEIQLPPAYNSSIVTLFDNYGHSVFQQSMFQSHTILKIPDLPTGQYILQVQNNEALLTKKIIKL